MVKRGDIAMTTEQLQRWLPRVIAWLFTALLVYQWINSQVLRPLD
jgi:hypothetical protein